VGCYYRGWRQIFQWGGTTAPGNLPYKTTSLKRGTAGENFSVTQEIIVAWGDRFLWQRGGGGGVPA